MYEGLSYFYDALTGDIGYDAVAHFIDRTVRNTAAFRDYEKRGEKPILLDAACGTGSILQRLHEKGYDCIGLDLSQEMLDAARERIPSEDILWICQDMCRMDLYGTVTAVCCMTDSVNHVTDGTALQRFFNRAHLFLDPGGVLIFDVLKKEHFTENGNLFSCFADEESFSCFWTGRYQEKTGYCTYDISCFERREDGLYTRTDDRVRERIWERDALMAMLQKTGFTRIQVREGQTLRLGQAARNRIYYICEKERGTK